MSEDQLTIKKDNWFVDFVVRKILGHKCAKQIKYITKEVIVEKKIIETPKMEAKPIEARPAEPLKPVIKKWKVIVDKEFPAEARRRAGHIFYRDKREGVILENLTDEQVKLIQDDNVLHITKEN